eukprot:12659873-Heterocapsa_arctica.AAC.1
MSSNGLMEGRDARGIPLKSDYEAMIPAPKSLFVAYTTFFTIFSLFGIAVGYGMYAFTDSPAFHHKLGM